jgi:anthranilate phosphoribosyltransferase
MGKPHPAEMIGHYVAEFSCGRSIRASDIGPFFNALLAENNDQLILDLLKAWNAKGVTPDELYGLAALMRSRMIRIQTPAGVVVDIVGTGGSQAKSFNVSTAAAFVVAGAGIAVAKHGNRAATSKTGSTDVLEALGVPMDAPPESAEAMLNEIGLCFMFAPRFHSLSRPLAIARKKLGQPTIFNALGPLCNPAGATHQLIGVWDRRRLHTIADSLARLGTTRSWVVNGSNGLDEITFGRTAVLEIRDGLISEMTLTPADFGAEASGRSMPGSLTPAESACLIREILDNKRQGDAAEDLVMMNAAAAICITERAATLREGMAVARESVRSGKALAKLKALMEIASA